MANFASNSNQHTSELDVRSPHTTHHISGVLSGICHLTSQVTPTVAMWLQLYSILCQTGF